MAGYAIGVYAWESVGQRVVQAYHGEAVMEKIRHWYEQYGFWGTLAAAITPIPYKIFTISSGVFKFPIPAFVAASVIGRAFRFFLVAALIRKCGPSIKSWIERRFNLAVTLFTILLIGGFVVIRLMGR